jgi:esterase/lipase superfamily enzyme
LAKRAKSAKIKAYKDNTAEAKAKIDDAKNSSTKFFGNLKKIMMKSSDVMIYMHGYNVDWYAALGGAIAMEQMLNRGKKPSEKKITVVLFSWPSNGSMMPFAAYKSDRTDARDSGKAIGRALLKLKDFLGTLRIDAKNKKEELCLQDLHLCCHSMGNYVLQKGLENKLIGYSNGSILPRMFKHIFLCAPDVTDNVFEPNQGMARLHEMAQNVTVYFNKGDLAMNISKFTKNAADRLWQVGNSRPALIHNKVHQVDCSPIVKGMVEHSYYLWATVNQDIRQSVLDVSFDDTSRNRRQFGQSKEWVIT